jgi:hypothetical protein
MHRSLTICYLHEVLQQEIEHYFQISSMLINTYYRTVVDNKQFC